MSLCMSLSQWSVCDCNKRILYYICSISSLEFFYYEHSFLIFVLYFIMCLTFAILCVFYVYFMCAAIGVIINDDDDDGVAHS